jgi:hypothetical protein
MKCISSCIIIFLLLNLISLSSVTFGQDEIEETLLESLDQKSASELLEQLESFQESPIDLNSADLKTLESFPLFSPVLARSIYQERTNHGRFDSWDDFHKRLKISSVLLKRLKSYFIINPVPRKKTDYFQFRSRFEKQIETSDAYQSGTYSGSPWKIYQRLLIFPKSHVYGGLLIEKDPGERQITDHHVGYVETDLIPGVDHCIFGNYRLELGQGLVLWGPYGLSRGSDPIAPVKKRNSRIKGYTSSDENSFLTGLALTKEMHQFRIIGFISRTCLDATPSSDSTVSSLSTSGFHRTESERLKKDMLQETLYGGYMAYQWEWGEIGLTGWSGQYSKSIWKEDSEKNYFNFQGDKNSIIGLNYNLFLKNWNISGETARSQSGGWAWIINHIIDLRKCILALSYRRYDPDFQNPHSHGFGSGDTQNEEGIYIGFSTRIDAKTKCNFYFDIHRDLWRTYLIPVPVSGNDCLVQIERRFSTAISVLVRNRFRKSQVTAEGTTAYGRTIDTIQDKWQDQHRIELRYRPSPSLRFKTRFEAIHLLYPKNQGEIDCSEHIEKGFILFHDINIKTKFRFQVTARWTTFDTDSYDSRIYAYENDLPGVLAIKPLYDQGIRWFLLLRWQPIRSCTISLKYSTTYHDGVTEWGTGSDRVEGDTIRHLGIQADFRF